MGKKSRKNKRRQSSIKGFFVFLGKFFQITFPGILTVALVIGVFFGVRNYLYADTFFNVKHISIQPPLALPVSERISLESKFLGKHLLKINLHEISGALEKDPEIKNVSAERKFPSTLSLNIEKRSAMAIVRYSPKGKFGVVSEDGVILQLMNDRSPELSLIEIPSMDASDFKVGYRIKRKGFSESIRFIQAYQTSNMAETYPIQKLVFDSQGNVSLFWENSPEIKLGRRPVERMGALHKITHLLGDKESAKISYIDLQFDNVIVKKKG